MIVAALAVRGARLQASLAVLGLVLAVGGWYHTGHWLLLIGGCVLGEVPFTLLVIYPVNRRLLVPTLAPAQAEALLRRWGRLAGLRHGL